MPLSTSLLTCSNAGDNIKGANKKEKIGGASNAEKVLNAGKIVQEASVQGVEIVNS